MAMFQMRPKEVRKSIIDCIEVGLVPFVTSSPGLGKSAIVKQIAEEFGLQLIDLRLSQCAPEDLMGLPMRNDKGRAEFMPFAMFPLEGDELPDGKNGWLLFLDEFNSASKSVQAAGYKLVLDRMVGQHHLHENVFCVAAGNLATDRAIVNQLSTAMQSRLIHLEMEVHFRDFMDHALKAEFDSRVMGFLEFKPSMLHTFKPDHTDKTFACSRTWEFASKLLKGKASKDVSTALLAGALSEGVAVELKTFMDVYDELPSYREIETNPETIPVPNDTGTRYAIMTMLVDKFKRDSFTAVVKYIRRFPPELQVVYFRFMTQRHPKMRAEKDFRDNSMHLVRFFNDDDDDANTSNGVSAAA